MGHLSSLLSIMQSIDKSPEEVAQALDEKADKRHQELKKLIENKYPGASIEEKEKKIHELEQKIKELNIEISGLTDIDEKKRSEAMAALNRGDFARAEGILEDLRIKAKQGIKKRQVDYAKLAKAQGDAAYLQFHLEKAYELYSDALTNDSLNWEYHNACGKSAFDLGQPNKAIEHFEKGIIIARTMSHDLRGVCKLLSNLGLALQQSGKTYEAITTQIEAAELASQVYGKRSINYTKYLSNLGMAYLGNGDFDKAIEYYTKAMAVYDRSTIKDHTIPIGLAINLGAAYFYNGDIDKASEFTEHALRIAEKLYVSEPEHIISILNNFGGLLLKNGDADKAQEYIEKSYALTSRLYGENNANTALVIVNIGSCWYLKGNYDMAVKHYTHARNTLQSVLGPDTPQTKLAEENLAAAIATRDAFK